MLKFFFFFWSQSLQEHEQEGEWWAMVSEDVEEPGGLPAAAETSDQVSLYTAHTMSLFVV